MIIFLECSSYSAKYLIKYFIIIVKTVSFFFHYRFSDTDVTNNKILEHRVEEKT